MRGSARSGPFRQEAAEDRCDPRKVSPDERGVLFVRRSEAGRSLTIRQLRGGASAGRPPWEAAEDRCDPRKAIPDE
jgi:hypothetical protein